MMFSVITIGLYLLCSTRRLHELLNIAFTMLMIVGYLFSLWRLF